MLVIDRLRDKSRVLLKTGQWRELSVQMDPAMNLDEDDAAFYVKAITSRNAGFGLASLAYLRRVVENAMNDLIDLSAAAFRGQGGNFSTYELEQAKRGSLEEKAELAKMFLPERLRRFTHNPF